MIELIIRAGYFKLLLLLLLSLSPVIVAEANGIVCSIGLSASYDTLKSGLASLYANQEAKPPIASLVAFVEEPDPRLRAGVLRTYAQMESKWNTVSFTDKLEFLQGKRLLNEKWAEEEETPKLSGESIAILSMHLWSLMNYAGFSKSDKIWKIIGKGWPECVSLESWKGGPHGDYWNIKTDHLRPGQCYCYMQLWERVKEYQLEPMVNAYKDMEKHLKEIDQPVLKSWPGACGPGKVNANPTPSQCMCAVEMDSIPIPVQVCIGVMSKVRLDTA